MTGLQKAAAAYKAAVAAVKADAGNADKVKVMVAANAAILTAMIEEGVA